jgi:hypothetical protein
VQIRGANNLVAAYADGLKVTSNNESVSCEYNWTGINGSSNLLLATGGTERARITSGGQLLVGTTSPSAVLPAGSIQYVAGAHLTSGNFGRIWVPGQAIGSASFAGLFGMATTYNAYFDSGWKSVGGGTASAITIDEGIFSYSNSNSVGSAAAALTWTTRFMINSSGNVGVGTTAPYSNLETAASGGATIGISNTGSGAEILYGKLAFHSADAAGGFKEYGGQIRSYSGIGIDYGDLRFYTANGAVTAERARIDSSGNLLVGTTSAFGKVTAVQSGSADVYYAAIGTGGSALTVVGSGSTMTAGYFVTSSGLAGSITCSGTTTTYNTSSDARLKHDIVDAPEASSLIDAIKVRSFKWNADDSEQRYGFVAQELVEVAPEAVSVPADEDEMMGVDYSKLVPMLVKEIQSLRARVAQLEGN